MFVVDASVWVAYVLPEDVWHQSSAAFLDAAIDRGTIMVVPSLFLTEVVASVARQRTPADGLRVRNELLASNLFLWVIVNLNLADAAATFGAEVQIRGADSIYASVAQATGLPLISWDGNHLTRAIARIRVFTPDTAP